MRWIDNFDLFLFDFDGLLVNTEELHFRAYRKMCLGHGVALDWTFEKYCRAAHFSHVGLKETLLKEFPELLDGGAGWADLYEEKKRAYLHSCGEGAEKGGVTLQPGVAALLRALEKAKKKRCVVTHSPFEQIEKIREGLPILKTIPWWLTREDYSNPKPAPDGYLLAMERFAGAGDRIVGFEDTFKGYQALCSAVGCLPVVISPIYRPERAGSFHFSSFEKIPSDWAG